MILAHVITFSVRSNRCNIWKAIKKPFSVQWSLGDTKVHLADSHFNYKSCVLGWEHWISSIFIFSLWNQQWSGVWLGAHYSICEYRITNTVLLIVSWVWPGLSVVIFATQTRELMKQLVKQGSVSFWKVA